MRLVAAVAAALALPPAALGWGGVYNASSDETPIQINVSDSIPVDPALPQKWADYLGSLVHGPELAKLTVTIQPYLLVQRTCGLFALACYSPSTQTMFITPDGVPDQASPEEVIAHEYGHHISNNRLNPPWNAETWGTKRWASYENVCARTARGELHPGDESRAYKLNPGEAFAETYRVLNEQKLGFPTLGWDLVDHSLFPDATALALLEQDVLQPWTGNTTSTLRGSFGGGVRRTFSLATPLDGTMTVSLRGASAFRMKLIAGATVVGSGRSISYPICGERALALRVERGTGTGAFTVFVSRP